MTTEELNPNHSVTTALRGQWHKVAAAMMVKLGIERVVLTEDDIVALARVGGINIVARDTGEALVVFLVNDAEGERLARDAGWLLV